jgi:hypothetical protein
MGSGWRFQPSLADSFDEEAQRGEAELLAWSSGCGEAGNGGDREMAGLGLRTRASRESRGEGAREKRIGTRGRRRGGLIPS